MAVSWKKSWGKLRLVISMWCQLPLDIQRSLNTQELLWSKIINFFVLFSCSQLASFSPPHFSWCRHLRMSSHLTCVLEFLDQLPVQPELLPWQHLLWSWLHPLEGLLNFVWLFFGTPQSRRQSLFRPQHGGIAFQCATATQEHSA